MSHPHIDRIRALVRAPRSTVAYPPAVQVPPAATVPVGGTCQDCDGCASCVSLARGTCDRCGEPYKGGVTSWEKNGEVVLTLHNGCVPEEPWLITDRIAQALAAEHDLTLSTRDLRWRLVDGAA